MQVVWFKRDLRVLDHQALTQAAQRGPVLPLYVVEPDLWAQPDMSGRQWDFVVDCLRDLRADLAGLGHPLVIRQGDVVDLLAKIARVWPDMALWSHEETGNMWTYQRDLRVGAWCRANGIRWFELRNHAVRRRQANRDGWAGDWEQLMQQPMAQPPALAPPAKGLHLGDIPDLALQPDPCPQRQPGGRQGREVLHSFLTHRGGPYRRGMSSPLAGESACSRLSPYLAWGSLSLREVTQATTRAQIGYKQQDGAQARQWGRSLQSFRSRLHWHCHFIQKLEDAPRIEHQAMHRAYDALRPREPDPARLQAWSNGETGLPFVDACMRYLNATGWLNFRMRAMVMAVASYHLWLDWRATGHVLARKFTDYEPGIHWSQVQMQSGTTGINAIRIYNPVKQGYDQDPQGIFIRRWVPELAPIDDAFLHEPWRAPNAGQVLGRAYPEPIVDHVQAARDAKELIWQVRKNRESRSEAAQVLAKHGSRKPARRRVGRKAGAADDTQLSLPL